jgi:transposase
MTSATRRLRHFRQFAVPMLAELVDAVVGVDTDRDSHEVEIALPTGTPIGTRKISNDTAGYAELLAWIVDLVPGPRLVVH